MYCSDKIMSRPIIPNTSHLHKVTSPTHNIPTQSQIPKKLSTGKFGGNDGENSVVTSFLHSINSKETPVKNNSTLYKTHHTLKLSSGPSEPPKNQFGLRKVNGSEGGVQSKVQNLNKDVEKSRISAQEPESVVVLRTKTNTERGRVFGAPKTEPTDNSNSMEDRKWKAKYEEAEKKRKEYLSESQKCTKENPSLFTIPKYPQMNQNLY